MNTREELAYRAALMYYAQNETMESIARQLKVSRSTVSRLIQVARTEGYIKFSFNPPRGASPGLLSEISRHFGVETWMVPVPARVSARQRLKLVAEVAGSMISGMVHPGVTIGIAWGNTLSAVSEHLIDNHVEGARIVQLNGAASMSSTGIFYAGGIMEAFGRAYRAQVQYFPVPAFFDYVETKTMLWRERSVRRVLEMQSQIDIAVFGVGSLSGKPLSMVYAGGYLIPEEMERLKVAGVVGDVCTVLLRADGTWEDLEINQRSSGPTPTDLQRIDRRICVVSGADKAVPLLAALRAGVVTDLVIDEECAVRLMRLRG
ncbi:transcriptional regulator [Mobiluncus mulieris]|uniref:Sugar-binding domain protein n=2 Tax=Mobiluncus mulieris TaxID=2052 RepID=E0QPY4_9ACTO|nr:sugar-binding domain-containing protein [Mobiluncus mulieris]EFM46364.1 putative sugar-binding domain protein [Mobiluncus mulieris ATCC 35239]EFN93419.1 putative sugar-binding domain protein [Mobiluncus mulieris FB024-16]MCU9993083.1 transcriptional regulator [Mobiluncus mulieris]NMW60653.1 transcriptional regulator [Mobiluncus mulieris]NMW93716.1 transcriptional regulator [Mobiluncus mulieris]